MEFNKLFATEANTKSKWYLIHPDAIKTRINQIIIVVTPTNNGEAYIEYSDVDYKKFIKYSKEDINNSNLNIKIWISNIVTKPSFEIMKPMTAFRVVTFEEKVFTTVKAK